MTGNGLIRFFSNWASLAWPIIYQLYGALNNSGHVIIGGDVGSSLHGLQYPCTIF